MNLSTLRDLLDQHFDLEELDALCFDLDIKFENLPGTTRNAKAQALVKYCIRHNQLPKLIAHCRQLRKDIDWPDFSSLTIDDPFTTYHLQAIADLPAPRYQLDSPPEQSSSQLPPELADDSQSVNPSILSQLFERFDRRIWFAVFGLLLIVIFTWLSIWYPWGDNTQKEDGDSITAETTIQLEESDLSPNETPNTEGDDSDFLLGYNPSAIASTPAGATPVVTAPATPLRIFPTPTITTFSAEGSDVLVNNSEFVQIAQIGDGFISDVAYSASTNVVAVATTAGIGLYDAQTWIQKQMLIPNADIESVAFNSTGTLIAAGSHDGIIRIWNTGDGELVHQLEGHESSSRITITFSSDGSQLASGSWFGDTSVRLWDIDNGLLLNTFNTNLSVKDVTISTDQQYLAAGIGTKGYLWGLESFENPVILEGHSGAVNSVAFSPDGSLLATGSSDRSVRIWSVPDGNLVSTIEESRGQVLTLLFSPDGHYLIFAGGNLDSTVRVWNVEQEVIEYELNGYNGGFLWVNDLEFLSRELLIVLASNNTITQWDLSNQSIKEIIQWESIHAPSAYFDNEDESQIILGNTIWDSQNRIPVAVLGTEFETPEDLPKQLAVDRVYADHKGHGIIIYDDEEGLQLWDVKSGDLIATMDSSRMSLAALAYCSQAELVAAGASDGRIALWNAPNGNELDLKLDGHTDGTTALAFNPSCDVLASGGKDNLVKLWSLADGSLLASLDGSSFWIRDLVFNSGEERQLIAAGRVNSVIVWDLASLEIEYMIDTPTAATSLSISPDGKWLAIGTGNIDHPDFRIRIWDMSGNQLAALLVGHTDYIWDLNFSPSGQRLVSSSEDGTVRVWNIPQTIEYPMLAEESLSMTFTIDNTIYLLTLNPFSIAEMITLDQFRYVYQSDWSPDGSTILFHASTGPLLSGMDIYVINKDGSNLVNLTETEGADIAGKWSSDGSYIVFESDRDRAGVLNRSVYAMLPDGTEQLRLTFGGYQQPAWSIDGNYILYLRSTDGTVFVMAKNGSNQQQIPVAASSKGAYAVWSPIALQIAFVGNEDGQDDIFLFDVSTQELSRISNNAETEESLAWSPDGQQVAYSISTGENQGVYVLNIQAGTTIQVSDRHGTNLKWAPDGTQIFYIHQRELYAGSADGSWGSQYTNAATHGFIDDFFFKP